jgi:hypothetical protein
MFSFRKPSTWECGEEGKTRRGFVYDFRPMVTIVLAGGSTERGETVYTRAACEFGRRVARAGWILRTGGGSGSSIMGAATDGALAAGGRVEGVILRKFWPVRHRRLHRLRVCSTFALRKAALFRGADGAVIFPGGFGTLDELGDLLALKQTGFLRIPILLMNTKRYFDRLLAWVGHAGREGFLYRDRLFEAVATPEAAVRRLRHFLS